MKLILNYGFCLLPLILLNYGCNQNSYSKSLCDTTYFHDDNNQNDTNKVVFENRVVFDTTANRLLGHIIDSLTKKPIIGAKVYITKDSKHFFDSTDKDGQFVFFKDNFSGMWQMTIYDDKGGHNCLLIKDIQIGGGLDVKIKLKLYPFLELDDNKRKVNSN